MPKRNDISSILIIGAGPIVIGQACEFDYSGTQACKVLKKEGYRVILVNSNPATIMTDPSVADKTYIEPLTSEVLRTIIEKERPDVILPTMGGQTALNLALKLENEGILKEFGVELIGAKSDAIEKAENRQKFIDVMDSIGLSCPRNAVVHSVEEAVKAIDTIGLPAIVRPSFTLGGAGGGIAYSKEDLVQIVTHGLELSPTHEVQIDESVIGWKEYEMEVIRDQSDNCIIICSIENVDPMGVHTGDSITVAPALTLTDKEYQIMRDASIKVLRAIGVDTGGSNVQFAVNPKDGRILVIEMNPRVSRSSALASKATGFPIAKVAALLAVGYRLDEIMNDCTGVTPASFEPTIDYVVTKIPRFTFEKFSSTAQKLSSSMKSVGEAMAIGRNFAESFQKALRSIEVGLDGLCHPRAPQDLDEICERLKDTTPDRLLLVAEGFRKGMSVEDMHDLTHFDPWFLRQIESLIAMEEQLKQDGLPQDKATFLELKKQGFSDRRLAMLCNMTEDEVRNQRYALDVHPVYKRVDTCAAEFESNTPYMYSAYEGFGNQPGECEADVSDREKVIILGSGPNRIGQGIEFDYACVHAAYALSARGYETIMLNCNPETVSTDYDTSDRLYFEPLTVEDVLEVIHAESKKGSLKGVIVQFGGQTPLKLASGLEKAGVPILGTSVDTIDRAEDRDRFKQLLDKLGLRQPDNSICHKQSDVKTAAASIGYPFVIRPSYVLGGRAMAIIRSDEELQDYLDEAAESFEGGPLLLDSFLQHAIELDVDALCDGKDVCVTGIMEHIEEAGIHSGDSACSMPPYSLPEKMIQDVITQTRALALELNVSGLINIQFAVKDGVVYILEVNPRASRTVPFVAKTTGVPIAAIASRLMVGEKLANQDELKGVDYLSPASHFAVKQPVFPFAKFPNVDVVLGPEMKSTGETMGIAANFNMAFAKAQLAAGLSLPTEGNVFISVKDSDKMFIIDVAMAMQDLGFNIYATHGTADYLKQHGVKVQGINKVRHGSPHIVDMIEAGDIHLIFNTTEGKQSLADSYSIRRTALMLQVPYSITISGARACVRAIRALQAQKTMDVKAIQAYHEEFAF